MMRRNVKRKFTQYADVPAALRGHLPDLNLYGAEHRCLDTLCLEPALDRVRQRNQKIAQRLQSVWHTCRQQSLSLAA